MDYGVCTWTFGDQPLEVTAKIIASVGLNGVELLGDLARYSGAEARGILDDCGLRVFSLTPADADIAHPDEAIRQAALAYYDRLIDFAAEVGQPVVSCHGLVGRTKPISSQEEEDDLLRKSVGMIAERAAAANLRVVFEVLNRYETHQIHNHKQALQLVAEVGADNLGVLLDAYHMNIEEADPAGALRNTGEHLWLYHAADSNRQGIGAGHTDFVGQFAALAEIGYDNAIILECTAPGPDPFTPVKAGDWRAVLRQQLVASLDWLKQH